MGSGFREGDGIGEGTGAQPERAAEGLGQAQGPSKGSKAKISSPLHTEGALTFKGRVKEGPFQPAEPQVPLHGPPTRWSPCSFAKGMAWPWEPADPARASSRPWTRRELRPRRCYHSQVWEAGPCWAQEDTGWGLREPQL